MFPYTNVLHKIEDIDIYFLNSFNNSESIVTNRKNRIKDSIRELGI